MFVQMVIVRSVLRICCTSRVISYLRVRQGSLLVVIVFVATAHWILPDGCGFLMKLGRFHMHLH